MRVLSVRDVTTVQSPVTYEVKLQLGTVELSDIQRGKEIFKTELLNTVLSAINGIAHYPYKTETL